MNKSHKHKSNNNRQQQETLALPFKAKHLCAVIRTCNRPVSLIVSASLISKSQRSVEPLRKQSTTEAEKQKFVCLSPSRHVRASVFPGAATTSNGQQVTEQVMNLCSASGAASVQETTWLVFMFCSLFPAGVKGAFIL